MTGEHKGIAKKKCQGPKSLVTVIVRDVGTRPGKAQEVGSALYK